MVIDNKRINTANTISSIGVQSATNASIAQPSTLQKGPEKTIISDEFMEWEERDESKVSFLKHCIAGKY